MTRGQLPQRAGSLGLNGGGTADAVPPEKRGGWPQWTVYPRRLPVNTVIHTTLAGIEPTTFRLLVRRATSRATETTISLLTKNIRVVLQPQHDN